MRILQVVPYFYPAWAYGGPAKLVYDTSTYFASQENEVSVFTSDSYDEKRRMDEKKYIKGVKGLEVFYFPNFNNFLAYTYNIFITPGMFVKALFEVPKFDVIHIHDFYTPQNVWIGWLSRLYKKPYVLSVHGCLEEERLNQRSIFKRAFIFLFGKSLLRNASYLIASSTNEEKAYKKFGIPGRKIVLLGHGIDEKEFKTSTSWSESRKYFGFKKDWFLVTFLGRIHKIKGLDLLVNAASQIKNENVHFVIAGSDDGYLSTLKKLIREKNLEQKIILLGTSYGVVKAKLFKATDLFVYPSYSEGFSLGILEMAASGKPLVVTKGCHFDAVEKYRAGKVVEPNPKAIMAAILHFVDRPDETIIAGENARKLINDKYTMDKIGEKLLSVYKRTQK